MSKKLNKSGLPLYRQLEEQIVHDIRSGKYPPGSKLPSISELEKSTEMSRVTIVKAMEQLVKDGFAYSYHGRGFFVTHTEEKRGLIGVIVPLHSTVYIDIYVNLFAGIRGSKYEADYRTVFMTSHEEPNRFCYNVDELVRKNGVRWLIAVPPCGEMQDVDPQSIEKLKKLMQEFRNLRVAIVDRDIQDDSFVRFVQDREAGVKIIIGKILENNFRKVLFLDNALGTKKDFRPFVKKQKELLKDECIFDVRCWTTPDKDYRMIMENNYEAVFCGDDYYARLLFNHAKQKPSFKLVGYNGTALAHSCRPTIATINSNLAEAGRLATAYLAGDYTPGENVVKIKPFFVSGDTF